MSTCVAEITAALRAHPDGLTAAGLAVVMGIGRQTASNRLSRMAAYGRAEKLHFLGQKRPVYRLLIGGARA